MCKRISMLAGLWGILAICLSLFLRGKTAAVTVIGGADGPTSIFLAGKIGDGPATVLAVAGGCMLVLAAVLFFKHRT